MKRARKKAIKELDVSLICAVDALVKAINELDIESHSEKRSVKTEYPPTETEGKRTVTEEEIQTKYQRGKVDVASLRTLVGVMGELRAMLNGMNDGCAGGVIILPARLRDASPSDGSGVSNASSSVSCEVTA